MNPPRKAAGTVHRPSTSRAKFNVKLEYPDFYAPKNREFELVVVPPMKFLAVDGVGDPNGPEFSAALARLYPLAYAVKFHSKNQLGKDYVVPPLEAVWWSDDPTVFVSGRREQWSWTVLNVIPEWITKQVVDHVKMRVAGKRPEVVNVSVRALNEGRSLQMLHVGPFAAEAPLLAHLHDVIMPAHGLTFAGPHHEIYLTDARRTPPERQITILRQPVKPV